MNTATPIHPAAAVILVWSLLSASPLSGQSGADLLTTTGAGDLTIAPMTSSWSPDWSQVIAGQFDQAGDDDFLMYDRNRGIGNFVVRTGAAGITSLQAYNSWLHTWDIIVPGDFANHAGVDDLLFYDARAGVARFYTTDSYGNIALLRSHSGWQEWDVIVPGQFGGDARTDLFFYSRARGEGKFFTTDGLGNISLLHHYTALNRNWDQIVPGNFDGDGLTDLFFYQRVLGIGKCYRTDGAGGIQLLQSFNGLRRSWDLLVSGSFGGSSTDDLFFYDRTAGEARYSFSNGSGGLVNQPVRQVSKTWFSLTARAPHAGPDEILAYDNTQRVRIHAVACSDDDGGRAVQITPTQVQQWIDRTNEVYARAGIRVEFDPATDYETLRDTELNSLDGCSGHPNQALCDQRKAAAAAWAQSYPCKIVVFFRHGRLGANAPTGGGFSSETANYVAMPGFDVTRTRQYFQNSSAWGHGLEIQNIKLLAHELGHYLGLDHPHVLVDYGAAATPEAAVIGYLASQGNYSLATLDGDRGEVFDTPPDVGKDFYLLNGWNPADLTQNVHVTSTFLGIDHTFNPDRHNVMSTFNLCDDYIRISPDQVRKMREVLYGPKSQLLDPCAHHVDGAWAAYGVTCPGSRGLVSPLVVRGNVETGQSVEFHLQSSARSVLGVTALASVSANIPLDLIGGTGCSLYVQPFAQVPLVTSAQGQHRTVVSLPQEPGMVGLRFFAQVLHVDSGAPRPLGIVTSNGVSWTIGGAR